MSEKLPNSESDPKKEKVQILSELYQNFKYDPFKEKEAYDFLDLANEDPRTIELALMFHMRDGAPYDVVLEHFKKAGVKSIPTQEEYEKEFAKVAQEMNDAKDERLQILRDLTLESETTEEDLQEIEALDIHQALKTYVSLRIDVLHKLGIEIAEEDINQYKDNNARSESLLYALAKWFEKNHKDDLLEEANKKILELEKKLLESIPVTRFIHYLGAAHATPFNLRNWEYLEMLAEASEYGMFSESSINRIENRNDQDADMPENIPEEYFIIAEKVKERRRLRQKLLNKSL